MQKEEEPRGGDKVPHLHGLSLKKGAESASASSTSTTSSSMTSDSINGGSEASSSPRPLIMWSYGGCLCAAHAGLPTSALTPIEYRCIDCGHRFYTVVMKVGAGYEKHVPNRCYPCAIRSRSCGACGGPKAIPQDCALWEEEDRRNADRPKKEVRDEQAGDRAYVRWGLCGDCQGCVVVSVWHGYRCSVCQRLWRTQIECAGSQLLMRMPTLCCDCAVRERRCACCQKGLVEGCEEGFIRSKERYKQRLKKEEAAKEKSNRHKDEEGKKIKKKKKSKSKRELRREKEKRTAKGNKNEEEKNAETRKEGENDEADEGGQGNGSEDEVPPPERRSQSRIRTRIQEMKQRAEEKKQKKGDKKKKM